MFPQAAEGARDFVGGYETMRTTLVSTLQDLPQLAQMVSTHVCVSGSMCIKTVLKAKLQQIVDIVRQVRGGASKVVDFFKTLGKDVGPAARAVRDEVVKVIDMIKVRWDSASRECIR